MTKEEFEGSLKGKGRCGQEVKSVSSCEEGFNPKFLAEERLKIRMCEGRY